MGKKDVYLFTTISNDSFCRDGNCNTYLIPLEIQHIMNDQNRKERQSIVKGDEWRFF